MQHQRQLLLSINPGAPVSSVPRSWFQFVNNVLRFLEVRNGRLIANNDKWVIECNSQQNYSFRILEELDGSIRIAPGFVTVGLWRIVVDETNVPTSGSSFFLTLKIKPRSSAEWVCLSSVPANTPATLYVPYYEFTTPPNAARATLAVVHHCGNVTL